MVYANQFGMSKSVTSGAVHDICAAIKKAFSLSFLGLLYPQEVSDKLACVGLSNHISEINSMYMQPLVLSKMHMMFKQHVLASTTIGWAVETAAAYAAEGCVSGMKVPGEKGSTNAGPI